MYVMGIDLGTTGCKATVFDEQGTIMEQAYREYPVHAYTGAIDPEMIWEETKSVIKKCTKSYPRIEAISTTSFGESVVLVDKDKQAIGTCILYTHGGVSQEWDRLNQAIGMERIVEITGHISHPMYTINRLMWYKHNQKELYEDTGKFMFISAFINMKLCDKCIAEDTHAARTMAYDIKKRSWSHEILEATEISISKLPTIVTAGDKIGHVLGRISDALGLENNPIVIVGGHDQPCVALGMGAVQGGQAVYGLGTVECLSVVLDHYQQNEEMSRCHLICAPHVVPGKYLVYGVLYSGGNVIKEIRNRCYAVEYQQHENQDIYPLMFKEMEKTQTQIVFIPHISGAGTPFMDMDAYGSIIGLRVDLKREELLRAALQGLGFDMRLNIDNMAKSGMPITKLSVAGGGAKSLEALRLRVNALGRGVYVPKDVQAGTKGVFFIAARSLGWIKSFDHINIINGQMIEPSPHSMETYTLAYERYQCIAKAVRDTMQLHSIQKH